MIRVRLLATAFLINGDDLLLMRKSPKARFFPGMWAPIGGHVENRELNDPRCACLREIAEETGLGEGDLADLSLKYVVHRLKGQEIRTQYVYFGLAQRRDIGRTEEGELHWVELDSASELDVSATTRFTLEHYALMGSKTNSIYVGTVDAREGEPMISWMSLSDWEG